MAVFFDIQGVQSRAHAERGISRYLLELAAALERWHPTAVDRYLVNPELEVPGTVEPLTSSQKLQFSDRVDYDEAVVYHVGSPVELDVPLARLWPATAQRRGARLVATLYDLIPRLFSDLYLRDHVVRRRYDTRIDLIRRADRVLAISEATAHDAVEELGIRPENITVVGTGVSDHFRPANDHRAALEAVHAVLPEIRGRFVLYTGGIDPRKNILGLLKAYAALTEQVREEYRLVVVCRMLPHDRADLDAQVTGLGIAGSVSFTGFVTDEVLTSLYQATDLFVFPSLYEGFGLPIAEAMACGAPVAVSRIPVVTELINEPAAQFNPHDPRDIAAAITRCLTDQDLRRRLLAAKLPAHATWRSVADRTAEAYAAVAAKGQHARRRQQQRPRIAFVTPLPPARSGVADESYRFMEALSAYCDIDAIADGVEQRGEVPDGVQLITARNFHAAEGLAHGYDQVFYCLGNSEYHAGAFELLGQRPGVVIAHDVRLSGLYGWIGAQRPDLLPEGFSTAIRRMYGLRLPPHMGEQGWIDYWDANRHGVLMAREAIARSERFLVHSNHAAQLARLDAAAEDENKVDIIPFRFPSPNVSNKVRDGSSAIPTVVTFGLVSPAKQTEKLVKAWPFVVREVPARLAVVGSDTGTGEIERLTDHAQDLGLGEHVTLTGDLDRSAFQDWIVRADMAVQLRGGSNGESSAVVAECLAAGIPMVVTAIGAARELPDEAVVKVDRDIGPTDLAEVIVALLRNPLRRAQLSEAGVALAQANSYERVAQLVYERHIVDAAFAGR